MLNLKIAEAFVDLSVQMSRYNRDMAKVRKDLGNLPGSVVIDLSIRQTGLATILRQINALRASTATPIRLDFRIDRSRASADLNLIMQQARAARSRAAGTIPIRADLRAWNRTMVQVFADLHRVRTLAQIPIRADTTRAHSSLNLLLQQIRAVQAQGNFTVRATRAGAFGGGGGYGYGGGFGGGRAGSFLTGAAQGLGLGYAANPYMMAGQALTRLATAAAASTIALETQSAVLRRIAGFTPGQTAETRNALFSIGNSPNNAASMSDLMGMATIGARMGVSDKGGVKGLTEFTRGLSELSTVINDMDAEKLADEVGRSLNNFQLGTEYARGFGSALTALDNASIASAADLLNVTQRLSGQAHAVGLSIQQTMALASVLKDVGISNEVAGTSFSQIFQKMASGSHKFAAMLEIDAKKFEDAYRQGPLEALGLVIEKLATMDDTVEKMQALDDLGLKGARVSGSLLRLTSVWDRLSDRIKLADKEMGTGAALAQGVAIQANTTEASITRMKNGFRELGDSLMSKVNPVLGGTADALGELAAGLAHAISGQRDFKKAMGIDDAKKQLPKPPEAKKGEPPTDFDEMNVEKLVREYTERGADVLEAERVVDAAKERYLAAKDAAALYYGQTSGAQRPGSAETARQAQLDAQAKAREAEVQAAEEKVAAARAAQRAAEELLNKRQRMNGLDNILFRAGNAITSGYAGATEARDLLRGGMLRAGAAGINAFARMMHVGEKTQEEIFRMSPEQRQQYDKEQSRESDRTNNAVAASASEMVGILKQMLAKMGHAEIGP